jgi:hypothetical protein
MFLNPHDFTNKIFKHDSCYCGYDAKENSRPKIDCPINVALSNHIAFPSFDYLNNTDRESPSKTYFNRETSKPLRHWAFIIEIDQIDFASSKLTGFTNYGEEATVKFDFFFFSATPDTFSWSDLKEGNTLAILYAEKHFESKLNSEVVLVKELDNCFIFKSEMLKLKLEANKLLKNADLEINGKLSECGGCGLRYTSLSRCSVCKIAKYCSRECQSKAWKDGHKKFCSQAEIILRLSSLPRYSFENRFNFKSGDNSNFIKAFKMLDNDLNATLMLEDEKNEKLVPNSNTKCGLCKRTAQQSFVRSGQPLTKTDCCNNWVCDDEGLYEMTSYERNSCIRNHTRYSLCMYHHRESHKGKWQDCQVCVTNFDEANYREYTNESYNFEK